MDTSMGDQQRPARGPRVEMMVWMVLWEALERVDLEWLWQPKWWVPYGLSGWLQEHL